MLYFLYQLSEPSPSKSRFSTLEQSGGTENQYESHAQTSHIPSPHRPTEREFVVDSPAFNEAFSNAGLLRLPTAEEPGAARQSPAEQKEKRVVERPKKSNGEEEIATSPEVVGSERATPFEPTEPTLLRDLPFTLQGLTSTNLEFTSITTLKLPDTLPVPLVSLLHTLAEPSLLYRTLTKFVESSEGGLVGQSFRSALGLELRSYLGLVATLEGQIRRALLMLDESDSKQGIGKAGVTLKRCVIWTREATMGLRLMSMMVEQSKGMDFITAFAY